MEQYLRDRIADNIRDTTILDTLIREMHTDYDQCATDLNKLCLSYADSTEKAGYTGHSDWAVGKCLGDEDKWLYPKARNAANPNYWGVTDSAILALCGWSLSSLIELSS